MQIINEIFFLQHYSAIKKIFVDKGFINVRIAYGKYGKICLYFDALEGSFGKRIEVKDCILELCNKNDVVANLEYASLSVASNTATGFDDWILLEAAKRGELEVVKQTVANGADINTKGVSEFVQNYTPMMLAAANNHVQVMAFLLEEHAKRVDLTKEDLLNAQDSRGTTPLHVAAFSGHKESIQWLLENGANRDIKNGEGKTAEQFAIRTDIAQLIRDFDKLKETASISPESKHISKQPEPILTVPLRTDFWQTSPQQSEQPGKIQQEATELYFIIIDKARKFPQHERPEVIQKLLAMLSATNDEQLKSPLPTRTDGIITSAQAQ